ncbi:MAG: heavy-metal-associated domain-containing protein [Clostridia bacterium]|jgi:copper chaperone CopZ|nr:heavy-metal-associated domain-containing protein [Clostridia bacterium]HCA55761.1 hypothetical protein [Oscillospiraceae bacterium]
MEKITVKIEGMMCGMCEAHINDVIRRIYPKAKKLVVSRKRNEAAFVSDEPVDEETLRKSIAETGYTFVSYASEPYEKKGLFG